MIFLVSGVSNGGGSWYRDKGGVKDDPFFKLTGVQLNVTAVEGRRAALTCSVSSLGDKQVEKYRDIDTEDIQEEKLEIYR